MGACCLAHMTSASVSIKKPVPTVLSTSLVSAFSILTLGSHLDPELRTWQREPTKAQ